MYRKLHNYLHVEQAPVTIYLPAHLKLLGFLGEKVAAGRLTAEERRTITLDFAKMVHFAGADCFKSEAGPAISRAGVTSMLTKLAEIDPELAEEFKRNDLSNER